MNAKENTRLNEVRLALNLKAIDNLEDKLCFNNCIAILSCLALSFGKEKNNHLYEIIRSALSTNFFGASEKEIIAVCKLFFKPTSAAKKLGITYPYYTVKYAALLSRDFIKEEWLDSLTPMFPEDEDLIRVINDFIEKFYFPIGILEHNLKDELRTYELDFWIIYNKLMQIYTNSLFIDKFIFNICNMFSIDYEDINYLKTNLHRITRSFPVLKYNNSYFLQELCNLCYSKKIKKGAIGTFILGKDSHYLYNNKKAMTKNILGTEEFRSIYVPTLDWELLDKASVIRFNELFHSFVSYDLN